MSQIDTENGKKSKKNLIIIISAAVLLVITSIVLFILFNPFKKAESSDNKPPKHITQGDDKEHTGKNDNSSVASGDSIIESEQEGISDNESESSSSDSESSESSSEADDPGSKIPDVVTSTTDYIKDNGFQSSNTYSAVTRKYDEFRFFNTTPSSFSSISKSARTLLREDLFVPSDTYVQPLDFQREVTQRNKYVFQNVASACTDPTKQFFIKYDGNPILWGQNLYTPWIVKNGDTWYVYYGGYGDEATNGMDTTFLATTKDPELRSGWTLHGPVVTPAGEYLCAQDPAVEIKDGKWVMVYSYTKIIQGQGVDWIGVSTSNDGIHWTPDYPDKSDYEITITNHERGTFDILGRPSLYYNKDKGRWEMYADGILSGDKQKGMYLLYSTEDVPMHWTLQGQIMANAGESSLAVIDGGYYFGYRQTNETWPTRMKMAKSTDGIHFENATFTILGETLNNGQVNNVSMMAFAVDEGKITAVLYGRSLEGWSHKVSIAYPQNLVEAWRGGERIDDEPTATSASTQVYDSKGSTAAVTDIRLYTEYGQPAAFETTIKLFPNMAYYFGNIESLPDKPALTSPYNNSVKQNWGPVFSWQPAKGAQKYKLMVAEDSGFTRNAFYVNALFAEEYRPVNALIEGKTYYWKVIAINYKGETESNVYQFTVVGKDELIGEYLSIYPTDVSATEDMNSQSNKKNLSDGPYYTFWTSFFDEEDLPGFVMDYGKVFPITRFYYTPRADGVGIPTEIKLEYSLDGKSYKTIKDSDYTVSNARSGGVLTNYLTLNAPVEARFIRFAVTATYGSTAGLGEFRSQVLR